MWNAEKKVIKSNNKLHSFLDNFFWPSSFAVSRRDARTSKWSAPFVAGKQPVYMVNLVGVSLEKD